MEKSVQWLLGLQIVDWVDIRAFCSSQYTEQLVHAGGNRCLDCDEQRSKVFLRQCDEKSASQKWTIEKVDKKAMAKWNKL